ncbi:MAG TPA: DUF882 domain-containing protein [Polyangia bacterium]|jgi:uncharacterized protein YcbK (DUF882 family)|nr:DUF882 domain-containing protein [Polyangia bacterium]
MLHSVGFAAVLTLSLAAPPAGVSAPVSEGEQAGHVEGTGDAQVDSATAAATGKRSKRSRRRSRVNARVVPDSQLRQAPLPPPSGALRIAAQGHKDPVEVNVYNEDGSYNIESLRSLDHVLRCRRTMTEKQIEPRLFVILSHIYDHFDRKEIEVISGYRNQRKQTSYHYKGTATDIRIAGVSPKKLRAFAETLDTGGMGIGIYPRSGFVHVDVRPGASMRWVDYSAANSNAAEKRPPRGWKRKKLQS